MSATPFRRPPLRLVTLEGRDVPAGGTVIPFAYVDANLNGQYDSIGRAGELTIQGVPVYADLNVNGQLDPGEPSVATRTASDRFVFDTDGTYLFRAIPLPGQRPTSPLAVAVAVSGDGFFGPGFGFATTTNGQGAEELLAVGAGQGGGPQVQVFNGDGSLRFSFFAYDQAFRGGVHVATADVTGDGTEDVITAPSPGGGPHVKVFDGRTLQLVSEWMAYDPAFTGGVSLAALVNRFTPGATEIVTGAGPGGGPHVRVFGADGTPRLNFFAYAPEFRGGVNVAAGPIDLDEGAEIVTGAGPGGGPHVAVFNRNGGQLLRSFFAYDAGFTGGVSVAVADVTRDGRPDIVTGAGAGGMPLVNVFDTRLEQLAQAFLAFDPGFCGGVNVAATSVAGVPNRALALASGAGGLPYVRVFDPVRFVDVESLMAFDPAFTGGVFVG